MENYKDMNGDSGVASFQGGADFIRVMFKDGWTYLYTNASAGADNVAQMKKLAAGGNGLNSFINRNVKKKYASKERA